MATSLRCPECDALLRIAGAPVRGQEITCPKCGSEFDPSVAENQSSTRQSKSSRNEDRDDEEETSRNSAPKSQREDDEANDKKPRKTRKKKKRQKKDNRLLIGLAGGGALLICGLIVWLVSGHKPAIQEETASTEPAPPPTNTNPTPVKKETSTKPAEQKSPPNSNLLTSTNSPPTTNGDPPKESTDKTQRATVFIQGPSSGSNSSGSGFIVKSTGDSAYIVTNYHIVQPGAEAPAEGARQVKPPQKPPANQNHPPSRPPAYRPPLHHGIGPHFTLPPTGTPSLPPMVKPSLTVILYRGMPDEQSITTNDLVAFDDEADLAVVRITGVRNLPAAIDPTEDAANVESTPISIFGFPGGSKNVAIGNDSIARVSRDQNNEISKLQINGELDHGNSGGPVTDTQGRLVGVATSTASDKHVIPTAKINQMFRGSIRSAFVAQWKQQGHVVELEGDSWLFDRNFKVDKHHPLKIPFGESTIKLNYPTHQFLVFARAIDPMRKLNSVNVLYSLAPPNSVSQGSQGWSALPNAQKLPLKYDDQRYIADIHLPPGSIPNQLYAFQFSFVNGDGATIYTEPYSVRLNFPKN